MDARTTDAALDARSIVTRRTIDAPRDLVFEAWTKVEHLQHWWGPNGFTTTTSEFDFREGGVWRFIMHGPDGTDYPNLILFEEIRRPERIVHRHSGDDGSEARVSVEFRMTVTFEETADGTTLVVMRGVFPTAEERDRVARDYGAVEGGQQTIARLAEYVATLA